MCRRRSASLIAVTFLAAVCCVPPCRSAGADDIPVRQRIDAAARAGWAKAGVTPAGRCDDATFLRRVYLDLCGTIPTYDEATAFVPDPLPDKRQALVDRLLADPRFAAYQAVVWDQVLFGRNPPNPEMTRKRDAFRGWLGEQFGNNVPYDRWVRGLLVASGNVQQQPPTLFYVQFRKQPEEAAVAVSRIFLGTQLQCARCHDHPTESWTQRDFYGMAAFFARVMVAEGTAEGGKRKDVVGEADFGEVLFTGPAKDQKPGQKGEPIKPKVLGGPALDEPPAPAGAKEQKEPKAEKGKDFPPPAFSRREKLADWVVSPDNPYFAAAGVNRVWAQFMGRGLVQPVDKLSPTNPASHPELLDALRDQWVEHHFDVKWLVRELVNSETYQLASTGPADEPLWFERARLRPLSAEQMLAAVRVATGTKASEERAAGDLEYFVRYMGDPTSGSGTFQASVPERLFMSNGGAVRQMIQPSKGNLADALAAHAGPPEQRVERLFWSVLSRPPRPEERARFVEHFGAAGGKPDALAEEAVWALLNSGEFRFNH